MPRAETNPTGRPLASTPIPVSATSQSIDISAQAKRVSIMAVGGAVRFELKTAVTVVASATTSHYLADGERLDFTRPEGGAKLAVVLASGSSATSVEVTELS